ncbi:MAG: Ig domain-containing protein, partial [Acidobacteriia bacterium]|nr:Ig domain-containing protein [Terriglobia bacterium]
HTFHAAGNSGAVTWSLQPGTSLPPLGLTLNGSTGELSGVTAAPAGNYGFGVVATDGLVSVSRWYNLNLSAVRFITGGLLPNATQGSPYTATFEAAGGTGGYTFMIMGGPPGLTRSPSGVLSGTPTAGNSTWSFTVVAKDSAGNTYSKPFSLCVLGVPPLPPSIGSTPEFIDAPIGANLWFTFSGFGGQAPYSWSIIGAPSGVTLAYGANAAGNINPTDAQLFGVPTTLGTYSITVTLTDSATPANSVSRQITLRVLPLTFEGSVPGGTRGVAYSYAVRAHGGKPPYTFAQSGGDFPNGLSINSAGLISGTPTENGNFTPSLTVTDANGVTFTQSFGLYFASPTTPGIDIWDATDLPDAGANLNYSYKFNAGPVSPLAFSLDGGSTVPLTMAADGTLSGIPAAPGRYLAVVRATDAGNAANYGLRRFRLQVTPVTITSAAMMPWSTVGAFLTTTLAATGGTGPYVWSLAPFNSLPPGLTLTSDGVLSGSPSSTGQYNFNLVATDAAGFSRTVTMSLSVYPAGGAPALSPSQNSNRGTCSLGRLQLQLMAAGGRAPYLWSLVSGTLPPGVALRHDNPSWAAADSPYGLEGVAAAAGPYSFNVGAALHASWCENAHVAARDGGTAGTLPSVRPLRVPMTISTGEIWGTPTAAGSYFFTVNAADTTGTVGRRININVPPLRITDDGNLPNAVAGVFYNRTLTVSGGAAPYNFQVIGGSLPSGLSLASGGTISGTPNGSNNTMLSTIQVRDSQGKVYSKMFAIGMVTSPRGLPWISPIGPISDLTLGGAPSTAFGAYGGVPPYTWAVTAGSLPDGMRLRQYPAGRSPNTNPNYVEIAGSPLTPGPFPFTLSVTDSSPTPVTVSYPYILRISVLDTDQPPNGTRGAAYSGAVRVLGGAEPYAFTYVSGSLPAGLSFNPVTGVFTGTPSENAYRYPWLSITDAAGNTLTRGISVNIYSPDGTNTSINNSNWGDATLNQPFSYNLPGGSTYAVVSGSSLPQGLTLSPLGAVTGTPTGAGSYAFLISQSGTGGSGVTQCTLNVTPVIVTTDFTLPHGNVGAGYSATLAASGGTGPYSWTLQSGNYMPPGLNLLSGGVISGQPISAGVYSIGLVATDAAGLSRRLTFTLNVYPSGQAAPVVLTLGNKGTFLAGRMAISLNASGGQPPYAYSYMPGSIPVSGMRVQTGAPLPTGSGFAGATGGFMGVVFTPGTYNTAIRVTDSLGQTWDAPISFTISPVMIVSQTQLPRATAGVAYTFQFRATGGNGFYTWAPGTSNPLPTGCSLSTSGLLTCSLAAGSVPQFRVTATDSSTPSNTATSDFIGLNVNGFAVNTPGGGTPGMMPAGAVNAAYAPGDIAVAGGTPPYNWCISGGSLPGGLSSAQNACGSPSTKYAGFTITGTPTGANNTQTFTLTVTDSSSPAKTATQVIALPVATSSPSQVSIGFNSIGDQPVSQFYWTLGASNGAPPITYSLESGSLPAGVLLGRTDQIMQDGAPGVWSLYGRPTTPGFYNFTLRATDKNGNFATRGISMKVSPLYLEYWSLPPGGGTMAYNTPYSQKVLVLGGSGSYNFSGQTPAGLTLDSTGVVSGSPLDTGTFSYNG